MGFKHLQSGFLHLASYADGAIYACSIKVCPEILYNGYAMPYTLCNMQQCQLAIESRGTAVL